MTGRQNGIIKMIALDLDGTTLNKVGFLTQRTRKTLMDVHGLGVHVVVSTGRAYAFLPKFMYENASMEYVITSNGAVIMELKSGSMIYENKISPRSVEDVANALRHVQCTIDVMVNGKAYIAADVMEEMRLNGSTYRDTTYVLATRHPVKNIYDFMIENEENIENISITYPEPEDKAAIREALSDINNITITSSFSNNFEIGGATTSKATALKYLMQHLDVSREGLMACGDSHNDIAMIEMAGVGVAVANAEPEVLKSADHITASNDEDGVAKAIEEFVLK